MTEQIRSGESGVSIGLSRSEIIDRVYEVAVDPERYESLLDSWEARIGKVREADHAGPVFHDPEIEAHFHRADIFLDRLSESESREEPDEVLARFENVAAVLVDGQKRINRVNATARAVFGLEQGVRIDALPLDEYDLDALSNAISEIIRAPNKPARLFRFRSKENDRLVVFQIRACLINEVNYALVATSEVGWPSELSNTLQDAFGLSETEVGVVRGLVECQNLRMIAEARGRSVETVRSQMRSIMAKTETHSQAELVRITLSLMDVVGETQAVSGGLAVRETGLRALEPRPFHSITRPDGRRLDYIILGDPTGKPVLFLPGDYGLIRWPVSAESEATRRGIKVIVPVRAGFGHSSDLRTRDNVADTLSDDFAAILRENNVKRCPVISTGSDSYFSFLLSARYPKMVSAMLCFGGALPYTKPEQFERMGKWHRFILANARYAPHLLPFMVKAGFFLARRIGKRGFIHAVYGDMQVDVDTFEQPEVYEAMVSGSEVALSDKFSAHKAFSREVIAQAGPDWMADVEAVRDAQVPVHFINGQHDPMVPMATLKDYQDEHDWIDYRLHADAGQLIFFAKWREAFPLLARYL